MHGVRDGTFWAKAGAPVPTGEGDELVVVGAGISGLAAAHLVRRQRPGARVLLRPLEDFGGHAKRNEFTASNGRRLIGFGGSQSLQTPSYFSPAVARLLADVGVETARFEEVYDQSWAESRGLASAVFFDGGRWGRDALVRTEGPTAECSCATGRRWTGSRSTARGPRATAKGNFWLGFEIDVPVSVGSYRFADRPADPVVLHLSKVLVEPGLPSREQALAGNSRASGSSWASPSRTWSCRSATSSTGRSPLAGSTPSATSRPSP